MNACLWAVLALLAPDPGAPRSFAHASSGTSASAGARPARGADELEQWVKALDAGREPEWTKALEALSALGPPAAERVLSDFDKVDSVARRARAQLLGAVPSPALGTRVLALLDDPDPLVRRELVTLLGNPALAEEAAAERVRALERLALEDPSRDVRDQARDGLAECGLEAGATALDRALERLAPEEAQQAAASLTQLALGRERLIARLVGSGADPVSAPLPDAVRAALLAGYGRALAEVPRGGEERRERLPLLIGRTHPALEVQAAARVALSGFVARAAELSEAERAERVLARLGEEGWPREECLRRRLDLAWLQRGDAQAALELARELLRACESLAPDQNDAWEPRARLFEAAALYALGQRREAGARLAELGARLDAGRARRDDLFPCPRTSRASEGTPEWTEGGGSVRIDRLHLAALVHLWNALLVLDEKPEDVRVLEELHAAHVLFLESRLVAFRTGATDPATLDSLLDRDLSPQALILFNDKLAPAQRGPALDRAVQLAKAFGRVAPLELMGLEGEPAPRRELSDVFFDPERRGLLEAMRTAQREDWERKLRQLESRSQGAAGDTDARLNQINILGGLRQELIRAEIKERDALKGRDPATISSADLRSIYANLLDLIAPSMHAHTLAGELRGEGRSRESRELCEHALATLSTVPLGSPFWSELSSARFELLRGSTLMDENRAADAEEAYRAAERRLAAIETQDAERAAAVTDPEVAAQFAGRLRAIREMRGDALLSLAVNANVRMGKPDKALEYFEQAFELNQSPFMRILRACYRARSGKKDEARTVLRTVVPVPSLYYNIACTHALLGEKDEAFDYLERDLRENHPSPGSLAQKRDWARKDPDLASLRGEPRFERLFGKEQ